MTTFKLSPSALKLVAECPRCFWMAKHKTWSRPSTPFPTLPTGMDRVLKEHFDRFMKRGELPPELKENSHINGVKLFENEELLEVWRNNFKGIRWTNEEGHILFGAVDNILMNGKKLVVLDYKTRGYPLKENTAAMNQNQLDTYNLLLRKNGYETEDYGFLLFYFPKEVTETGEVIFDTELVKMETNPDSAEKIFNDALKLLQEDCPKECCVWCEKV
jgi:hypothetical protein